MTYFVAIVVSMLTLTNLDTSASRGSVRYGLLTNPQQKKDEPQGIQAGIQPAKGNAGCRRGIGHGNRQE
jgi:hypothetical protein